MKQKIKNLLITIFKKFNIGITSYSSLQQLKEFENDIESLLELGNKNLIKTFLEFTTKAQNRQDLFVLTELNFKKNGFFVEFGATNGVDLSNTYLLEKQFGWNGILAEPAKCWHKDLIKNRTCHIETDCVWSQSNSNLIFNETAIAELSTINQYSTQTDQHQKMRKNGITYDVKTISLIDLLDKHNAPHKIDYLSIDTEGSEYAILKNFDFHKYQFKVITCEHNYIASYREKIFKLLTGKGYKRKFTGLSKWDDWYILS